MPDLPEHLCERNLATEGPCYGPVYPAEQRGPAWQKVHGRWLCPNHIAELYGTEEADGPKDPDTPYWISRHGLPHGPIKVGDFVKVLFNSIEERGAEGMWIRVTKVEGRRITGVLDNVPLDAGGLRVRFGETVTFPASAVRTIMEASDPSFRRE